MLQWGLLTCGSLNPGNPRNSGDKELGSQCNALATELFCLFSGIFRGSLGRSARTSVVLAISVTLVRYRLGAVQIKRDGCLLVDCRAENEIHEDGRGISR